MNAKRMILAAGLVGLLMVGLIGTVGAQDGMPPPDAKGDLPQPSPEATSEPQFPNRLQPAPVLRALERAVMDAVTKETGLQPKEVNQQLRAGSTLADIIQSKNGSVDNVVNAAVATLTDQINTAVKNGRLGQQQADTLLKNLPDRIRQLLNGRPGKNGQPGQRMMDAGVLALAAKETGLKPREILEQLKSGKTLGDVLKSKNVDVNTFIDTAVNDLQKRLDKLVAAKTITQEREDTMLKEFRDRLTNAINGKPAEGTPEASSSI
jgi:hypothetical protein